MKRSLVATCKWCSVFVKRTKLTSHWREDCASIRQKSNDEEICTNCQDIKPRVDFFHDKATKRGVTPRCKTCHRAEFKDWCAKADPKRSKKFDKPSSWVLHPCEYCGTSYNRREMRKHLQLCEKYTGARKPWKRRDWTTPLEKMESMIADHAADPRGRQKSRNLKSLYGIDIDTYRAMFAAQDGRCAICQRLDSGFHTGPGYLHVDHDHETGAIRGLLCNNCNHGLGAFRDNPALLLAAIDYLLRHRSVDKVS